MSSLPPAVRWAITWSGLISSTSCGRSISEARMAPSPSFFRVSVTESRLWTLKTTPFRFNSRSTTSSCTPSSDEYSWPAPSASTSIIRGFNKLFCMKCPFQYPRLVTPIRLMALVKTPTRASGRGCYKLLLTRIQLDDQRFVDVVGDFVTFWQGLESAFHFLGINRHPARHTNLLSQRQRFQDTHLLLRLFAHGDDVADLDSVGGDVDDLAVDGERFVRHQLTRFSAGRAEAHAVSDVVQTRFQQLQQRFAGVAFTTVGFSEVAAELAFQDAVHAFDFLLFAQLVAVVRGAGAGFNAVLAWFDVQFALRVQRATGALQEQVSAFTTGKFCFRSDITCHDASF